MFMWGVLGCCVHVGCARVLCSCGVCARVLCSCVGMLGCCGCVLGCCVHG